MAIFPNWNSLESVSRIHRWAEIAGMGFLFLLFVAEVIAYRYGHRKDVLTEKAERTRVEEADRKLAEVRKQQEPRRLSDEQRGVLIQALSLFRGQKVSVVYSDGSDDGQLFGEDFVAVFVKAGWDFGGKPGVDRAWYDQDFVGVQATLNQEEVDDDRVPEAFRVLIDTLDRLGIIKGRRAFKNSRVPASLIEVRIGRKPPSEKPDVEKPDVQGKDYD